MHGNTGAAAAAVCSSMALQSLRACSPSASCSSSSAVQSHTHTGSPQPSAVGCYCSAACSPSPSLKPSCILPSFSFSAVLLSAAPFLCTTEKDTKRFCFFLLVCLSAPSFSSLHCFGILDFDAPTHPINNDKKGMYCAALNQSHLFLLILH